MFVLQKPQVVKAFSKVGDAAIIAAFNLADADRVSGFIRAGDAPGVTAAVAYEHISGRLARLSAAQPIPVTLGRFEAQFWTLHKPRNGFAALGRRDKLNGVAAVKKAEATLDAAHVVLHEGGPFAAYASRRPVRVEVDGKAQPFTFVDKLLLVDAPVTTISSTIRIDFS